MGVAKGVPDVRVEEPNAQCRNPTGISRQHRSGRGGLRDPARRGLHPIARPQPRAARGDQGPHETLRLVPVDQRLIERRRLQGAESPPRTRPRRRDCRVEPRGRGARRPEQSAHRRRHLDPVGIIRRGRIRVGLQEIDQCRERHPAFAGLDDHRVGERVTLGEADFQPFDEFGMPRPDSLPVPSAGHRCRVHVSDDHPLRWAGQGRGRSRNLTMLTGKPP